DVDTSLESLTLSVKGYADRVGNSGNANREYSLPLTPVLSDVSVLVTPQGVTVSGGAQYVGEQANLILTFKDSQGTSVPVSKEDLEINSNGQWSYRVEMGDLEALLDGELAVSVSLLNQSQGKGTSSHSTTLDRVAPQVSAVDWKKSQVSAGEDVALKVTFSEPVSQPSGSVTGDALVIWSEGDELRQQWTGQVTVPMDVDTSLESLTLSVKDYADRVGNLGDLNNDFSLPLTAPVEAPDNSGTGESSEMSEASNDPSEHDQGTLENKKEEMRIAA
ncbi:hypothetical protein, partial [Vibrio zhanjiangensis]|uniref:hypothetical protein n=1 Tax=Vibrio zhanjiangensis TaxID=1046128 RepID=UPI0024E157DB